MIAAAEMSDVALWMLAGLMTAVGASVGSFLNVVIFRLPAGKSLVHPPSHCPQCQHAIRARDNVPILGWFLLGGRCRDCNSSISFRYPAVESLLAAIFLVLFLAQVAFENSTLPQRVVADSGLAWGTYVFHLLLITTLVAAAFIQYDGNKIPGSLYVPAWLVGGLAPMYWLALRPVPLAIKAAKMEDWQAGAAEGVVGLLVGFGLAGLAVLALGKNQAANRQVAGKILPLPLVGLFLGWQAAAVIAAAGAALWLLALLLTRVQGNEGKISPLACLACAAMIYILAWAPINDLWPWLAGKAGWLTLAVAAGVVLLSSLVGGKIAPARKDKKRKLKKR